MTNDLPGAQWFKSSHSGPANECVEVAWLDEASVGVRDSKDTTSPALIFSKDAWSLFMSVLRRGDFGRPDT
ncbi:DUF397 domain-containing protein [Nocardia sp. NBC_00416]|uniref:DUF397 domain-containing protein n=1 Tax=Nocardia sp. NBC_00416 TaxID=2975991 RepID=UPI002E1EE704